MYDSSKEKELVCRLPDLVQVQEWIEQAKGLPRVISSEASDQTRAIAFPILA